MTLPTPPPCGETSVADGHSRGRAAIRASQVDGRRVDETTDHTEDTLMGQPDYRAIKVPEGKKPTEYSVHERRAEILKAIEQAGHPDAINKAELARRYDRDRRAIYRDFERLREFILDDIGPDRVDTISQIGYQKAIKGLLNQEEFAKATRALDSWNEWLFDRGKVDKSPDKQEVDATVDATVEKREAKVYAGVDLSQMPGVDPSRVIGARVDDDEEMEGESPDAPTLAGDDESAVDIPLAENGSDTEDEGDE